MEERELHQELIELEEKTAIVVSDDKPKRCNIPGVVAVMEAGELAVLTPEKHRYTRAFVCELNDWPNDLNDVLILTKNNGWVLPIVTIPIGANVATIEDRSTGGIQMFTRPRVCEEQGWDPKATKKKGLVLIKGMYGSSWLALRKGTATYRLYFPQP